MKQINEFFNKDKFDYARPMPKDEFEAWIKDTDKSIRWQISEIDGHNITHIWKHDLSTAEKVKAGIYGFYVYNDSKDVFEKVAEYNYKEELFYCKKSDKKKFGFPDDEPDWDLSNVNKGKFNTAKTFDADLSKWDISQVNKNLR